ncbi:HNH endonuclease [Paenibacillus sp. NPDC056933]|uniref:HNH endonuclease n=1 Tax=Paenibacillus sp. NPDC056933 TaxID=3345968 RepID=UPI0036278D23
MKLYFPSAEEDEAMVMQSVCQEPPEAGHVEKSCKVMQDPGVKSFGNPQGKSFTLGDSELVMNAQEGALYISMAAGNGVTLNSTTHVQIQCMGDLNISGASVSLEGTEGLYIQTMTDHVELVEEVNGKSENVVLEAEIHRSFDMIQSAFDQSLASMGESALKEARLKRNWEAREKGKLDGVIEEGKSLLSMVGDVADLAFTGIVGGDNAQGLYSWVKGEQVGSLTERNATVQGTITGVNNVIDYTGDLVTGQKSGKEIWQDVSSAGEAYAKPFMDLKGEDNRTMLTLTEQESHDAGLNDVGATMRVVDTAGAIFGGASLVKNGVKVLKGGGKKSGHADGDGAKGGVPHGHGDGPEGTSGGAMKDGKLKTNAALMPSSLAELGERISQALGNMTAGAAASVPWRVQRVRLSNGQTVPVIVKNDHHMFSEPGGNREKGSGSGSSKGSPNTSHVDSKDGTKAKDGNTEGTSKKTGKLELSDITEEIMATKPKYARIPEKWYAKGGHISIDEKGVWTYTNKSGISISYPNGFPDFSKYYHPNVKPVKIEYAQPKNYPKDYEAANKEAGLSKSSNPSVPEKNKPPEGYTWHHYEDGKTMVLVEKDIHDEFKHMGGQSIVNGTGGD